MNFTSAEIINPYAHANLILAGVPIGRDADASPALRQALSNAQIIAAEDTRRLLNLAGRLGIELRAKVVSFHEHNEENRIDFLLNAAKTGQRVLQVSDAGMPAVADPGYRLVAAAVAEGVAVSVLPGPSAVLVALALSGLPSDRFCFEGFIPRRSSERKKLLQSLSEETRTMVFFDSPRRVGQTLGDMAEIFGADRCAAMCRELTKTYEQVHRASLAKLAQEAEDGVLGEITLVVAGAKTRQNEDDTLRQAQRLVAQLEEQNIPRKSAVKAVSAALEISKNRLYTATLEN